MSQPLSLDIILAEFNEDDEAWVLQDEASKQYVIVPDPRFPDRHPIRFFMRRSDAEGLLAEIQAANDKLRNKDIVAVNVKLLTALRNIASDNNPFHADAFVVHTPNEVLEYLHQV